MAMGDLPLAVLKVEELLKEVKVDYSKMRTVELCIAAVRDALLDLKQVEANSTLASEFLNDLGVPDDKVAFCFRKPDSVEIIGSFVSRTVTKPIQNVDLAIRIPKACFHEKDFLNHRYHAKRLLYLCVIERSLSKCPAISNVEWSFCNDDSRKPILVLHPADLESGGSLKFLLRLFPTISLDYFDVSKLGLERNNVRDARSKEGLAQPTPHYSSSIIEDSLMEEHSSWLQSVLSKSSAFRDAVCIAKVWLRQWNIKGNSNGLNGFLMAMFMVHLSTSAGRSRITNHMSALQIFRVTLDAIGSGDILGRGVVMEQNDVNAATPTVKSLMKTVFDVVMIDPSGRMNLTYRLTKGALAELKDNALRTLEEMKGVRDGGFDVVFMTPVDFAAKFDYHIRLDVGSLSSTAPCCLDQERWRMYEWHIETILCRALGDRARLVWVMHQSLSSGWMPSQGLKGLHKSPLLVGIILNNIDVALRMADIGPSAEDKEEAKKFRAFWAERSELRRFKDGKISETAVWECEPWQRHLIIQQITEHVCQRHFSLSPSKIKVVAGQLDFALNVRGRDQALVMPKVLEAFDTLSRRLRSMEKLPLKVVSVQPLSAEFRHTAVYYPQPHPLAEESVSSMLPSKLLAACLDPLEVVIQLEGSGRWPDDLVAIKKTKLAFCLNIAESMQEKWGSSCVPSEDGVDILLEGFVFRISILYEKDPTLLDKEKIASSLASGSVVPIKVRSSASNVELSSPKTDQLLRSLHASILHGLNGQYPAFSPTVRLAKRWLASHLFSGVLAEEAVELLVAYLFVKPAPYTPPSSRITGLLRFLHLLTNHDWFLAPLIVNINGNISPKDEETIMSQFDKLRLGDTADFEGKKIESGGPVMYIATAYDLGSETWTRGSPDKRVLKRLIAYAKSSSHLLGLMIRSNEDEAKWQSLFRTPLNCYDVVALLHQESLPHPSRVLLPAHLTQEAVVTKNPLKEPLAIIPQTVIKAGPRASTNHLLIGFDPVSLFVADLKQRLGDAVYISYDNLGSDVVGLTLTKVLTTTASSKRKRVERGMSISVKNLISHILSTGDGLVKSVHLSERLKAETIKEAVPLEKAKRAEPMKVDVVNAKKMKSKASVRKGS